MFSYQTEKRLKYYDQVIDIYKKTGYSAERIEKLHLVPVGRHAIREWITNFVAESSGKISPQMAMQQLQENVMNQTKNEEIRELKEKIRDLESQLQAAEVKAEFYDEMINVAEAKFKIPIRKKAGAKQ
jgi:vacuolar-type H+-ATPase subunit I/STV1